MLRKFSKNIDTGESHRSQSWRGPDDTVMMAAMATWTVIEMC